MRPAELLLQKGLQAWLAPYAGYLLEVLSYNGRRYTITSVYRSPEKQQQCWDRFKAGLSKYPAAPPGHSKHEQGRAFDFTADEDTLRLAGAFWESMGGRWGGRFKDPIHFEA
ncbi:unnamed protein product [marine sediment metagenome]|uniref:D-alanyl-D-alanine carboxypeptidase-like core domain-containing protein n=1 Tax=marine sediment metagenome TaxID=412755 RepID=X1U748_9ZZZZ